MKSTPFAARSKARFCLRSLAGIAGSNPAGGIDVSMLLGRVFFKDNSLVHQLVNKYYFDNIKMHGTNVGGGGGSMKHISVLSV